VRGLAAALALALAAPVAAEPAPAARAARVEFTPVPDMEAVHASNPHDHRGKPLCQRCHLAGEAGVSGDPVELCTQCHDPSRMKHPVGVTRATAPAGLPLGEDARVVCHTCHDPHDVKQRRSGLRLDYVELCLRCHERHRQAPAPATAR